MRITYYVLLYYVAWLYSTSFLKSRALIVVQVTIYRKLLIVLIFTFTFRLPAPSFPPTDMMVELIGDAIAIAIVAFAISISMAEGFANKYNYKIDANQVR